MNRLKMRNFGNNRISEVINHVKQQFSEVTGTAVVTVEAMPVGGGSVNFSTLNLAPSVLPFTGTYFTGIDIPVTAVPAAGYVFRGWSDASLDTSSTINFCLSANKNLTAIFESTSNQCQTDTQSPTFLNCPANITLSTTQNCETATWGIPTATDNCTATPSVSANFSSGACFPIGTSTVIYTATDGRNNKATCRFNVVVQSLLSSSDLALTITSNQPNYVKYTVINEQVIVKNIGNQLFTNIKIKCAYPQGTVYGGNSNASDGTWNAYCGNTECNEWHIPSLAAGATATLTRPLYVINTATIINASAELLTSTPTDQNVTNNQASISIPPRSVITASMVQRATQLIPIVIQKISPNPTSDGAITVDLESISEREVTFVFYNTLGKILKTDIRKVESGRNKLIFDVLDLESGLYLVIPTTKLGRHIPTKFVKM